MTQLIKPTKNEFSDFKWRTSKGELLRPSDMATSHVFYALRMIWNNTMLVPVPDNPRFYTFGSTYSEEYLKDALKHFFYELQRRNDITDKMFNQLSWMSRQLGFMSEDIGRITIKKPKRRPYENHQKMAGRVAKITTPKRVRIRQGNERSVRFLSGPR